MTNIKTAESVSPGHPDKICDQISDAILDAHLAEDPKARVAVDVAGGHGIVFVTGEVTSKAKNVDVFNIVKRLAGDVKVVENIAAQSLEIASGVDVGGAGDQGIMIGYAVDETPELLPLEVVLARDLNQYLYKLWPYDGKTQVTTKDGLIDTVVASFQNAPKEDLLNEVRLWVDSQDYTDFVGHESDLSDNSGGVYTGDVKFHINPAGDWIVGGFDADAGLTGRKLAVDNYGPSVPVGGGAFSGKDASKVDRSAAYAARKIAVDYLKNRSAHEVYVTLAYAIGYDKPVQARVSIDGIEEEIVGYDLSPAGIIEFLDLNRPQYEATARYGHFADKSFVWNR